MGYSRWTRADLHVHTPGDKYHRYGDVGGPNPNPSFADVLVKRHADNDVRILAVTDHNRVDWWPELHAAGVRHGVTVYPGIEINVGKCHLVAIWDCTADGFKRAEHFLGNLFGPGEPLFLVDGSPRPVENGSVLDKAKQAIDSGALVFAPHTTQKDMGLFATRVCNISSQVAKSEFIAGFDVWGSAGTDVLANPRAEFGDKKPVWFVAGDVRSLDDVGVRVSYLKMSENPTLESLRQAFLMAETRIRLPESMRPTWGKTKHVKFLADPAPNWARFTSLELKGGFHDGLKFDFGPGLNAVIGGKGTGKSTLVEILRYVTEAPESIAPAAVSKDGNTNRSTNFPANAEGFFGYVTDEAEAYVVHRVGESPRSNLHKGQQKLGIDTPRRIRVRIYGQRELAELHKVPEVLRDFIARHEPAAAQAAQQQIALAIEKVRGFDSQLATLEGQLSQSEEHVVELADLEEKLGRYRAAKVDALVTASADLTAAATSIAGFAEWSETAGEDIDTWIDAQPPELVAHSMAPAELATLRDAVALQITKARDDALAAVKQTRSAVNAPLAAWQTARDAERARINRALADAGLTDVNQLATTQARVEVLRRSVSGVKGKRTQLETLGKSRDIVLGELLAARREKSRIVEEAGRLLTQATGPRVRVTVDPLSDGSELVNFFASHVLERKASPDQASRVSAHSPSEYARAARDSKAAVTALGLTSGMADKVMALGPKVLRELELVDVPDLVKVEINTASEVSPKWVDVNDVSPGQAATAMLSLALVSGDEPVVIDQPEDDLDNRFIYDEVVQLVAEVASRRQVIVATHNANIPILGDAELIVAFDAENGRSKVLALGGLDELPVPQVSRQILEGGDSAFAARASRYGTLAKT